MMNSVVIFGSIKLKKDIEMELEQFYCENKRVKSFPTITKTLFLPKDSDEHAYQG